MVARFDRQKRQQDLINALAGVHSGWRLQFAGEGPTETAIKAQVAAMGLSGRISFLGSRMDIPDLLSEADIFALATDFEGLPLSILEAMRAGLPVVASAVGGVPECVLDARNGFLVRRNDVAGLRACLDRLLGDLELRRNMGREGRRLFEGQFVDTRMLKETGDVYLQIIGATGNLDMSRGTAA
jgi:glycosyltransferase involved in cell wall biosynthesis